MISRRDFMKLVGGGAALVASGCGGGTVSPSPDPPPATPTPVPPGSLEKIEHIIFTMQENRSFDHYFGKLPQYRASKGIPGDVDGLPENASNPSYDQSYTVFPHHLEMPRHENLSPGWNESHRSWNRHAPASDIPKLDGFVFSQANFARQNTSQPHCDFEGLRAMGFYDERDIPFYYELASQFAISDRHFSSVLAATLANRMYLISGSSHGRVFPSRPTPQQVQADTIFDLCERNGVSWKIYVRGDFTYFSWFAGWNTLKDSGKIVSAERFFEDAKNGNLPKVAMFESGTRSGLDEHPLNNIHDGAQYMERFFRAIMEGPAWRKTAAILTYDEGGGFFDHVPPPNAPRPDDIEPMLEPTDTQGSFGRYGYRVPLIVVSPWVKRHYVSHIPNDFTSILRLIERRFGLPSLTRRDAAAHDLLDMFDFSRMSLETPPPLPQQHKTGDSNVPNCHV
jgi:phospholipase C